MKKMAQTAQKAKIEKRIKTASARHEYKYLVNDMKIALLESRIRLLMAKDANAQDKGYYQIRSVYFDDIYNTCYNKNEAGTDPRAKYRIRIYNGNDAVIKLEKKVKQNGRTRKYAVPLTREQALLLLSEESLPLTEDLFQAYPPLLQQFALLQRTRDLKPKVIVIYDRIPYVEKKGNVRVTFDRNISASTDFNHFFEADIRRVPIMPAGEQLLEVKYDTFLPRTIREALDVGRLKQETFSKFYLCRKYMRSKTGV